MKKTLENFKNQMLTKEQMKQIKGGTWTCVYTQLKGTFEQTYPSMESALRDCNAHRNCAGCGNDDDN